MVRRLNTNGANGFAEHQHEEAQADTKPFMLFSPSSFLH